MECVLCRKLAPNKTAKKEHDEAMQPKDGLFLCNHCNTRVAHMALHLVKCRLILMAKDNPFAVKFTELAFKVRNNISMKSPILKPLPIYGKLTVDQVEEKNKHQMDKERWRVKAAMVHDSARRSSSHCCAIYTSSRYNAKPGADEWNMYHHDHYSTLHEPVNSYTERHYMYRCGPAKRCTS